MKRTPAKQTPEEKLAADIRATRDRLGLTQIQFARLVGIRQQKLSQWENGRALRGVIDGFALQRAMK